MSSIANSSALTAQHQLILATSFRTLDDVSAFVRRSPDKTSASDTLPVNLSKQVADELAPYLTVLFNLLLVIFRRFIRRLILHRR